MKYFQRVQVPYAQELRLEALVSRKLVYREVCSEARLTGRAGKPNGKLRY